MTVPARQILPSLLQVDAIVTRLRGDALAAEVCRFLHAEISTYAWVGVYRNAEPQVALVASDGGLPNPQGPGTGDPTLADQAVRERRPEVLAPMGTPPQLAVPIVVGGQAQGALAVLVGGPAPLDASDRRFLEDVARRMAAAFSDVPGPRLL